MGENNTTKYKPRKCVRCGDMFIPTEQNQRVCTKSHDSVCPICGDSYGWTYYKKVTCGKKECKAELRRRTNIEKFGTEWATQNPDVQAAMKQTNQTRYGMHPMQTDEVKEKIRNTAMERYGETNSSKAIHIGAKISKANLEAYFDKDKYVIPDSSMDHSEKLNELCKLLISHKLEYQLDYRLGDFTYALYVHNCHTLIHFDWSYSRNTRIANRYAIKHANKHNFLCIHIYPWDNLDIILKDFILPMKEVHSNDMKVYKLENNVVSQFLKENDLKGDCWGKMLCLGLVKDNTLYQVIVLGTDGFTKDCDIRILRLCNKVGYHVIFGAEKLFDYVTQQYGFDNISVSIDIAKYNADVWNQYKEMTFNKTYPAFIIWCKDDKHISNIACKRVHANNILKTNYPDDMDSNEIMVREGWKPMWSCGTHLLKY